MYSYLFRISFFLLLTNKLFAFVTSYEDYKIKNLYLYCDTLENKSFESIVSNEKWLSIENRGFKIKEVNHVYWTKFEIKNPKNYAKFFLIPGFWCEEFDVFVYDNKNKKLIAQEKILKSIEEFSSFSRAWPEYEVNYSAEYTYYTRNKTLKDESITFILVDSDRYMKGLISKYTYTGFFYGFVILLLLYNLNLFISSKEYIYLYYACYIFCFALFAAIDWFILADWLSTYYIHPEIYTIPYSLMFIFFLLYSSSFLNLRILHPKLFRFFISIIVLKVVIIAIGCISQNFLFYQAFVDWILFVPCYMSILYLAFTSKERAIYIYLTGCTFVLCGLFAKTFLNHLEIFFDKHPFYLFGMLDMLFFSFALTQRYSYLKKKLEEALIEVHSKLEMLKTRNSTLEEIAFSLSHEARGPLATIKGLIYVLNREQISDTHVKDLINKLETYSNKIDKILTELVNKANSIE